MKRIMLLTAAAVLTFITSFYALNLWQKRSELQQPWHGTVLQNVHNIHDISLIDSDSNPITLADYRGENMLVFFGFVNCPDVCPTIMMQLRDAYISLGEPDNLQIVMITVDPEHDTPEVLGDYVQGFHPDFIGLTGSDAQIAEAAQKFFIGYFQLPDVRQFSHTDSVALIDSDGNMRLVYTNTSLLKLREDVARVLAGQFPTHEYSSKQ